MTVYDYYAEMYADVLEVSKEYDLTQFEEKDELQDYLYDELFNDDSVTGNASGSYTFNSYKAQEYVMDNMDLLKEAYNNFDCMDSLGNDFINENWERMDVTIRCYLLGSVLADVIEENYEELTKQHDSEVLK